LGGGGGFATEENSGDNLRSGKKKIRNHKSEVRDLGRRFKRGWGQKVSKGEGKKCKPRRTRTQTNEGNHRKATTREAVWFGHLARQGEHQLLVVLEQETPGGEGGSLVFLADGENRGESKSYEHANQGGPVEGLGEHRSWGRRKIVTPTTCTGSRRPHNEQKKRKQRRPGVRFWTKRNNIKTGTGRRRARK